MKIRKAKIDDEVIEILKKISGIDSFKDKSILELGCYTGELFPHFQKQGAFIEGIDYGLNAVNKGKNLGRLIHFGNIDDTDGAIGLIKGRIEENEEVYDMIFSHDVWTPFATALPITIKNLIEVPVIYLKPQGYLIHVANATKGLHKYQGELVKNKILQFLGEFKYKTQEAIAWRKRWN